MTASWSDHKDEREEPYPFVTTHQSPIDPASVEERMTAQLDWEKPAGSVVPRDLSFGKDKKGSSLNELRKGKGPKQALAVLATAAAFGGAVHLIGKAADHELDSGKPTFPQPKSQMRNSMLDSNGNVVPYPPYQAEVDKQNK